MAGWMAAGPAGAVADFDLAEELNTLHQDPGWAERGRARRTLAQHRGLRVVLIALRQGKLLRAHHLPGPVTMLMVEGDAVIWAEARAFRMRVGRLVSLEPKVEHQVEAINDCGLLVTIGPRRNDG